MTHFLTRAALPAAAVLLLAAAPAHARASVGDTWPGNWLRLTVTQGDARSGDTRGTLLLCDPPQGHSRAGEACAALADTDGDIHALPARRDAVCTLIYAPVTARAEGRWNGHPVHYTESFANPCEMEAMTGAVFALDD